MSRERRSRTKAVVTVVAVLLVTALLAYALHLRPARQAVPTPEEVGPSPEEVVGPGQRPAAPAP
jgi:hypothetical protein